MAAPPRSFSILIACLWTTGFFAARIYSQVQDIPWALAAAVLPALLAELALYSGLAFEDVRSRIPLWLTALSGAAIYCLFALPAAVFSLKSAAILAAGGLLLAYWFKILRPGPAADIGFLALAAAPMVFKWFATLYARPQEDLRLDILGQLFWIRTGVIAVLRCRPQLGVNFGFLPSAREWKTGLQCYAMLLPLLAAGLLLTGFVRFSPVAPLWKFALVAAGTFLGILWVVALSEEFLFRGLLQQWIERWTGSSTAALVGASVLFGLVHLGFRQFPNWKLTLLAGLAGLFYGTAFRRGGGIRAAMVCHALTVATWRALFR
jgi:uncharacterized protein